jgi:hypothetical protein
LNVATSLSSLACERRFAALALAKLKLRFGAARCVPGMAIFGGMTMQK